MRQSAARVAARPRRSRAASIALALGVLLGARAACAATPDELADAEAKAEYAYFTEDGRALERLVASLAPLSGSNDPIELYAYAHAEFRRLQLASLAHAERAAQVSGVSCIDALERRAEKHHDAEGLALEAACAGYLAAQGRLAHLTAGHRRDVSLAAARELAPDNPRVELVGALIDWFRSDAPPAARQAARAAFGRAAAAFDTVAASAPGEPTWGAAESWLFVARGLEEDGDLVGARSAYERALLVAPDFAAARRGLTRLATHR